MIRSLCILIVFLIVFQSLPTGQLGQDREGPIQAVLDRIGLWQRPWTLFAPEVKNELVWLSAELDTPSGTLTLDSPDWERERVVDKFWNFRWMNYFTRFSRLLDSRVADDYAAYLIRKHFPHEPVYEVRLYRNSMRLSLSSDETLPGKDDMTRVITVVPLTVIDSRSTRR
jgi:hypothetical protein